MDWDGIAARWKQASGKIKEKWSRLTDEDLKIVRGDRERLERKIQECYGFAPDHVRKEIEDWMRCLPRAGTMPQCRKTKLASVNSTQRRRTQTASGCRVTALFGQVQKLKTTARLHTARPVSVDNTSPENTASAKRR